MFIAKYRALRLAVLIAALFGASEARPQSPFRLVDSMSSQVDLLHMALDSGLIALNFFNASTWTQLRVDTNGTFVDRQQWTFTGTVPGAHPYCALMADHASVACVSLTDTFVLRLERQTLDGTVLWAYEFPYLSYGYLHTHGASIFARSDGSLALLFSEPKPGGNGLAGPGQVRYILLDTAGNFLVNRTYPTTLIYPSPRRNDVRMDEHESALYFLLPYGGANSEWLLSKLEIGTGEVQWQRVQPLQHVLDVTADRVLLQTFGAIEMYDTAGTLLLFDTLAGFVTATQSAAFLSPLVTSGGSVLIPNIFIDWIAEEFHLQVDKWKVDGTYSGRVSHDNPMGFNGLERGVELPDGRLLWIGLWSHPTLGGRWVLVPTDSSGVIFASRIEGTVRHDSNADCAPAPTEPGIAQTFVVLEQSGLEWALLTSDSGFFSFPFADSGLFIVRPIPPSYLWEACPDAIDGAVPDSVGAVVVVEPTLRALTECPLLTIDLATPFLRRCFSSTIHAQYCNRGTAPAVDATLDIILPPGLDFDSASQTIAQLADTIRFALGTVQPGQCGQLWLKATPNCDSTAIGDMLCVEARIGPDTLCPGAVPGWSGALLEAEGTCTGDSIHFTVRNIGAAESAAGLDFIVIEDHVITRQGQLPSLLPGDVHIETIAAGQPARWRSGQEPGAPAEDPSVVVFGCQDSSAAPLVLEFSNQSGSPFHATLCRPIVGAFDPNDKQGYPLGYGAEHYLEPGTEIDYLIRFQNTGTDTAFSVVVVDTLSHWLDLATLRFGPSSHAYTVALLDTTTLAFTMANIMLPDSNVNEPASHGFVQFSVKPRADVPLETDIYNEAEIYFDFNAPIVTNATVHRIGQQFIHTAAFEPRYTGAAIVAYPNPFTDETRLHISGLPDAGPMHVWLFDSRGQVRGRWSAGASGDLTLRRTGWPAGLYWVRVELDGRWVGSGKITILD